MRAVLDTNVWLSGLFWEGESSKIIELVEKRNFTSIISKKILLEIVEVLNREAKFQRFLEEKDKNIKDVIKTILSISKLVYPKSQIKEIKDHPADNIFLEAASEGKANFIVSYDNHLLFLVEFNGIRIVKPGEFLMNL